MLNLNVHHLLSAFLFEFLIEICDFSIKSFHQVQLTVRKPAKSEKMANCVYIQIKDLTLSSHSFFLNALIIAKTEKRIMNSQRNGANVGVITFTVRDTREHFINCIMWGSETFIDAYDRAYKIGHIITIYQPSVSQQNENSSYRPRTSSPFEITVKENKAFIHRCTEEPKDLLALRNQAFKSTSLALYLRDLDTHPDSEQLSVDLVVLG